MARSLHLALSCILFLAPPAQAWARRFHRDTTHGFELVPPPGWRAQDGNSLVLALFVSDGAKGDPFRENLNIVLEPSDETDIAAYAAAGLQVMEGTLKGYGLLRSGMVRIGGVDAVQSVYRSELMGNTLRMVSTDFPAKQGGFFVLTGTCLDKEAKKYVPPMLGATRSFRTFTPTPSDAVDSSR